jgi:hypothetical protein
VARLTLQRCCSSFDCFWLHHLRLRFLVPHRHTDACSFDFNTNLTCEFWLACQRVWGCSPERIAKGVLESNKYHVRIIRLGLLARRNSGASRSAREQYSRGESRGSNERAAKAHDTSRAAEEDEERTR